MDQINQINEVLDRYVSHEDREGMEKKLNDCINLMGTAARLKASAHRKLQTRQSQIINNHPDENTRKLRMLIDAGTVEEQEELVLSDRLYISLCRVIDGLKAILNIRKEESMEW